MVVGDTEVVKFGLWFCHGRFGRQLCNTLCFADFHEPTHKLNGFASENRKSRGILERDILQAHRSEVEIYTVNDKSATVNLIGGFTGNKMLTCESFVRNTLLITAYLLCVIQHLLNKRVAVRSFGVNRFAVHNATLGKSLPDSNRVNVLKCVLLGFGEKLVLFDELGDTSLNLRPGHFIINVCAGNGDVQIL